jgi:hypothetical protein
MIAAWESFHRAAHELASAAPIKQRLTIAFSKHLEELVVEDLPAEMRSVFMEISSQLTSVRPLRGESAVWATVRKMSNDEAECVARRIVQMLGDPALHRDQSVRGKPRRVLSLYAAEG